MKKIKIKIDDSGFQMETPTFTYTNKKFPGALIEIYKDPEIVGARITQTDKNGSQTISVNDHDLRKMIDAIEKTNWKVSSK